LKTYRAILVALAAPFLFACGAKVIDYVSPSDIHGNGSDGGNGDGGSPTLAQGGDYQWVPYPDSFPDAFGNIVGSSPNDLWGAEENRLWHYDGNTWTEVPLHAPGNTGSLTASTSPSASGLRHLASAGPQKAWIAHSYGVVRVDTTGKLEDFTSQVPHDAAYDVGIDATADYAVAIVGVASNSAGGVFAFDGAQFRLMPPRPSLGSGEWYYTEMAVRDAQDVWVKDANRGIFHFDGSKWESLYNNYFEDSSIVPFASRQAAFLQVSGEACPAWCHPSSPPYGLTDSSPWKGFLLAPDDAGVMAQTDLTIEPPVFAPPLQYVGIVPEASKSQKLALVGCVLTQDEDLASRGYPFGHYVVHEFDQTGLHERHIANPSRCDMGVPPGFTEPRPLLDGTWVLPPPHVAYVAAVLMAP
jgi:hypothetical protein